MLMGPRACMVGLAAMLPPGIERTSKPSAPHPRRCPLLEVKRTCSGLRKMSAYDPKRTWSGLGKMSAYDPKRLKIVALQLDLRTPFRRWQIPGVIIPCWRARAASGQAVAAPTTLLMKLRRRIALPEAQGCVKEAGYLDGQNVTIDFRWAEGHYDRLPEMAADLVRRKVAVLVATGGALSVVAAKGATSTIPIVFTSGVDPGAFTWRCTCAEVQELCNRLGNRPFAG